jgi:transcriptional regulator with XRE-family HTH domain
MIRLTIEREKRGLSRGELARRAKMNRGDVGKIEAGRSKPYDAQLKKLGRAMRMRVPESLELGTEVTEAELLAHQVWLAQRELKGRALNAALDDAEEDEHNDDHRQTTVEDFIKQGAAAQAAIDELTKGGDGA